MTIGLQGDGRQCLVTATSAADDALVHYRDAYKNYPSVRMQSDGETLAEQDLVVRAAAERDARRRVRKARLSLAREGLS